MSLSRRRGRCKVLRGSVFAFIGSVVCGERGHLKAGVALRMLRGEHLAILQPTPSGFPYSVRPYWHSVAFAAFLGEHTSVFSYTIPASVLQASGAGCRAFL
jgi:hypothetical protein